MKIFIKTLGCKLNFSESSSLGRMLLEKGHELVGEIAQAQVCIVNTCSVTDTADGKNRQAVRFIKKHNPTAKIIITGCYAQLNGASLQDILPVDMVVGTRDKFAIPHLLERLADSASSVQVSDSALLTDFVGASSSCSVINGRSCRTRLFLKVQDGCDYFCSYCTVPLARGRSRNGSIASLVAQAQEGLAAGAKEIVLTGVNVGDFGKTTHERFLDLLRSLDEISSAPYRLRLSSCEPNLLTDEIIDFVAHSKHFAPHFHIPLQSGSDAVLRIMRRRYTRDLFARRVEYIRTVLPYAFIGVDCMVGVRGETEEYFADYLAFIRDMDVSRLHVFPYSERRGTAMVEMPLPRVAMAERRRRAHLLQEISEQKHSAFIKRCKGLAMSVLWEAKQKDGQMYGFTDNYIQVHCACDNAKINTFEEVVL